MTVEAKDIRAARIHLRDCWRQMEAELFNEQARCSACWDADATLTEAGYHRLYVPKTRWAVSR